MTKSILDRIKQHKIEEVSEARKQTPLEALNDDGIVRRDFIEALRDTSTPAIIAEIKKASPSKGIICNDFDVTKIAKSYERNHARCLSVLTDEHFFKGHDDNVMLARNACSLPILRKEFIVDAYQVHQSKAIGADCILLIAAMLDDYELIDFCQIALELDLAVLVESHTAQELERSLILPTPLMGINNRDLHTFQTNLQTTIELASMIPSEYIIITESGISTPEDIHFMRNNGIHHFLIGEQFMRMPEPGDALRHILA